MTAGADKIMFEIYRQADGERNYRVVYFTELDEHNKEKEISDAMNGDFLVDGYIATPKVKEAKTIIAKALLKLNGGEAVTSEQIRKDLAAFLV